MIRGPSVLHVERSDGQVVTPFAVAVLPACDEHVGFAADLAREHGLRGYDAVHCAAAATLADADLVAAADDRALLRAWRAAGVATYDTSQA